MNELLSFLMCFVLVTILNIFLVRNNKSGNKINWQHYFWGYIFSLYLIIALTQVVGFPSFREWARISTLNKPIFNPIINLVPFKNGIQISSILNIIFFMPFGFLLPTLWRKYKSLSSTLCAGVLFSLIIEIGQMFVLYRASDIDDLIMNTLGTILGWIIFALINKIPNKFMKKSSLQVSHSKKTLVRLEPYMYIFIAIVSSFLN